MTKAGTRQPTLPDSIWERVYPVLQAKIGLKKPFPVLKVAEALGLSSPSVSAWINDKGRPTLPNLIQCLQFIGEDPVELIPELYEGVKAQPRASGAATRTELDPRYLNREEAIRLLLLAGEGTETEIRDAADAAGTDLKSASDLAVLDWVDAIRPWIKILRRGGAPKVPEHHVSGDEADATGERISPRYQAALDKAERERKRSK